MKKIHWITLGLVGSWMVYSTTTAAAQDNARNESSDGTTDNAFQTADENATKGERDPNPAVPGVGQINTTVVQQAGTGGDVAYAEAGVIELGGAAAFEASSAGTFLSIRPTAGWFIINNFQLSGILDVKYSNPDNGGSYTTLALLADASVHLPFNDRLLWFAGLGLGPMYNDDSLGLAVRPRVGLDILIGRSGILRPALDFTWSTTDIVSQSGQTLVAVQSTFGASIGYSIMF